jgi:hypothetical protein
MKEPIFTTDSEDQIGSLLPQLLPRSADEAFSAFLDGDNDSPSDCHNHCRCWDSVGECCECGDVRTPNHEYSTPKEMINERLVPWSDDDEIVE